MNVISFITFKLATLVLLTQLIIVLDLALNLGPTKLKNNVNNIINKYGVLLSFMVALVAMSGSLFFSEVVGLIPCELCWYQRILMYPLVLLFGAGIWLRDKSTSYYGALYSGIGLLISGYHYLLQINAAPPSSCSINTAASCSNTQIQYFGYITIPMMAFTAFLLIFLLQITRVIFAKTNRSKA